MTTDLLLSETQRRLPAYRGSEVEITSIAKGGSDRRFYRIRSGPDRSLILVKYDPRRDENLQYVAVAQFLAAHGISAPHIFYHDSAEGLIWMEDLGETDLFSFRYASWPTRRQVYEAALEEVIKLHNLARTEWAALVNQMPAAFDTALYLWEQRYFFENCLEGAFKLNKAEVRSLSSLPALERIAAHLASLPRRLVHRDFQSQNVVLRGSRAYFIDFQGMRPGLPEYDVASLLYDPYVVFTAEERAELSSEYIKRRGPKGESLIWRETLRLCAMQRLMQALGAYGYLGLVKGNKSFLAHIPNAIASLREVLAEVKGLESLGAALASLHWNAA